MNCTIRDGKALISGVEVDVVKVLEAVNPLLEGSLGKERTGKLVAWLARGVKPWVLVELVVSACDAVELQVEAGRLRMKRDGIQSRLQSRAKVLQDEKAPAGGAS